MKLSSWPWKVKPARSLPSKRIRSGPSLGATGPTPAKYSCLEPLPTPGAIPMADYDDAERNALQKVKPADQLKWLLEDVDDDLTFFGWLQTQVAPPPGVPQLRCDCVAGLHSRKGTQPPWACLIEAQGQPLANMAVWMTVYLGLLHNVLRFDGHDPFQMMGVILNLS